MNLRRIVGAGFAAIASAALVLPLAGCGGSSLSGSSTCQDYLAASSSDQHTIVNQLATQYQKPDFVTPLGFPEVAYWCASSPTATLGHFFKDVATGLSSQSLKQAQQAAGNDSKSVRRGNRRPEADMMSSASRVALLTTSQPTAGKEIKSSETHTSNAAIHHTRTYHAGRRAYAVLA